jgi:hypothetical protein
LYTPPPPPPRVRRARKEGKNPKSCDEVFERLITEGVDPDDLYHEVTHQVGGGHRGVVLRECKGTGGYGSCVQAVQRKGWSLGL